LALGHAAAPCLAAISCRRRHFAIENRNQRRVEFVDSTEFTQGSADAIESIRQIRSSFNDFAVLALKIVDYGSVLILVYAAFSHGVVDGIWHQIDASDLLKVALVDITLLASVMTILIFASRQLGFSSADEIAIVFCGSKKSLVNGVPIASLLFAGHVGLVVIPLMLFHQMQLMVCASLARRYAARRVAASESLPALPATSA